MLKVTHTEGAPAAIGPYSQAVSMGDMVFTSGQIPLDPQTMTVVGDEIKAQAEQVMKNIGAILEASGTSFDKVIKTTCFLDNMDDFAAFNEVYGKYFVSKPARSCVAVKTLPKNVHCEYEVIASNKLRGNRSRVV